MTEPAARFTIELALDRIEAALAAELPGHMRAFAAAYAAAAAPPPAPPVLSDPATLTTAERAMADPELAGRGRALWRQCALLAIDNAVPARAGGWDELEIVALAREAAAMRRWGRGFLAVAHEVFEVGEVALGAGDAAPHPPLAAPPVSRDGVLALWHARTALPPPTVVVADARPRTFAVAPGEAIVVVRAESTVTAWSQVAHELGHAWVAIAGLDLPRTLDEAVAISAARTIEGWLPAAAGVHARQEAIANRLARIERALYAGEPARLDTPPPWALWHDPGAQAAYVAAWQRAWTVERFDDLRARLP